jgi:hypothetical protein
MDELQQNQDPVFVNAALGEVPKFSGVHQDWEDFHDQLLFYFEGHGIQNATQ